MALSSGVVAHLAKRGFDMLQEGAIMPNSPDMDRDDMMQMQQEQWNDLFGQVHRWGAVSLVLSIVVMGLVEILIRFCLQSVIMTLAMIETPTVDYIPIASLDNIDSATKDVPSFMIDGEPHTVIANKPITSRIRGTIRHLVSHGGKPALWRGVNYAMIYWVAEGIVRTPILAVLRFVPAGEVFAATISAMLLAQLHCAWTHKTITMPSSKSFRERVPARSTWRQLWIPNAVAAATAQASFLFMRILVLALFDKTYDHETQAVVDSWPSMVLKLFAVLGAGFFLLFFVILPNYAARVRIEGTLLPDDEDTIVPFDRTFGGKVTPVVVGGSGFRYVKEVCRTFDREARLRIIKLFFKAFAIEAMWVVVFVHVLSFEMFFIITPLAKEASKRAGAGMMQW